MRRTVILTAIAAIALSATVGVGITLADTKPVPDPAGMTSMMTGGGMSSMMGTAGMEAMHTAMHDALAGNVPADVLAACDAAHDAMTEGQTGSSTPGIAGMPGHSAHHPAVQP